MNIIFMGTPDFAVPVLRELIESGKHQVTAVVTQPDKARGRSGKLTFTPVKELALEHGIQVYTPEKVKAPEFVEVLRGIPCDLIVVVAFGQILSKEILDMPEYGCVNVHASLLPRWRGAAPIQWSIIAGDAKTGITTMQMNEGLDTGDILLTEEIELTGEETGESLFDDLSKMGGPLLIKTIEGLEKGEITPVKQNDEESTYAKMLTKDLGKIDFSKSAVEIERLIRGLNSWPSAYTYFGKKMLKIWEARVSDVESVGNIGEVVSVDKESFGIQTGQGILQILEVQLEGKKRMKTADFMRGNNIEEASF